MAARPPPARTARSRAAAPAPAPATPSSPSLPPSAEGAAEAHAAVAVAQLPAPPAPPAGAAAVGAQRHPQRLHPHRLGRRTATLQLQEAQVPVRGEALARGGGEGAELLVHGQSGRARVPEVQAQVPQGRVPGQPPALLPLHRAQAGQLSPHHQH